MDERYDAVDEYNIGALNVLCWCFSVVEIWESSCNI